MANVKTKFARALTGSSGNHAHDVKFHPDGLALGGFADGDAVDGPLHVKSPEDVEVTVETTKTNGVATLKVKNDADAWRVLIDGSDRLSLENAGAAPFRIEAGAPDDMFFGDSSGNVGFGVANPTDPVAVSLPGGILGLVDVSTTGGANGNGRITWDVGGATRYTSFD